MKGFLHFVVFIIFTTLCQVNDAEENLPSGSEAKLEQKRFYIENSIKTDWIGAYVACIRKNINFDLAAIETYQELEEVRKKIRQIGDADGTKTYWLSGSDYGDEGNFLWVTTGTNITIPWRQGQPNNGMRREDEHCVELWKVNGAYGLNDVNCGTLSHFICQYYDE